MIGALFGLVVTRLEELIAAGVLALEIVMAIMAFQESNRFRKQFGTTPLGFPSLGWALVGFLTSLLAGVPLWIARTVTQRRLAATSSSSSSGRAGAASSSLAPAAAAAATPGAAASPSGRGSSGPAVQPIGGGMDASERAASQKAAVPSNGTAAGTGELAASVANTSSNGGEASSPGRAARPAPRMAAPPADWYPDPVRRHELRYWDGSSWTEWVSDEGMTDTDPLTTA